MKHLFTIIFLSCASVLCAQTEEQEAVKAVVNSAYVQGIHNGGSLDDVRKGFHPSFNMLRLIDNEIKPLPIDEWIANIEKSRKEGKLPSGKTEAKFLNVDVTGNAAVVALELYRDNKKTFTDYIVLYKFNEGWRIVSKTYYRH